MQRRLIARARAVNIWLMAPLLGLSVFMAVFVSMAPAAQAATTSSNLNFQARLLNNLGGIVPDGTYNIDFKLYTADGATGSVGTCTGSCVWEETRTGTNRVQVIDGYFSVNLGSVTPFGGSINWDQQLWLTMNIGGTGASPVWDGEMQNNGHSIALTALPYSFTAGRLAKTDGSGNRGTLSFNTVANNPNLTLPDVATGTICIQGATACGFIVNGTSVQAANFNVQSSAAGSVTGVIQGASGQTVDILQAKANGISNPLFSIGKTGNATFRVATGSDSATAFQIQNAGGNGLLTVDTTGNGNILIGNASNPATLTFAGGATATRPASPTTGTLYFDTSTNQLIQYNGTKWVSDRSTTTKIVAASNSTQAEKDAADYVATGTGDQATINSALTAAAGGTVYLMEGTYSISAAITVPNNTTLSGAGAATIVTIPSGQNGSYNMIQNTDTTTGTGVTIQNLMIDGNISGQTSGKMYGIYFNGVGSGATRSGGKISGVIIQGLYGSNQADINLSNSSNNLITGNVSQGSTTQATGIALNTSSDNTVSNNVIQNRIDGITLFDSSGNTITGNTTLDTTAAGISTGGTSSSNTITSNTTSGNSEGVLVNSSNNTVTGNTMQGNQDGVWLLDASDNTVTGNTISGSTSHGIRLFTSSSSSLGNVISGNKIHDSGGASTNEGIYFTGSSSSNSVTGNDITDTGCSTTCYAIDIAGGTKNRLSDNHFLGDGTHAASIHDAGTNTVYASQPLTENGDVAFKAAANSSTTFQVQNATNAASVVAVDTSSNQLVLGTPGAGGITGQIKLYYAGSSGSITLQMSDPGSNNDVLILPSGGGTICTTANGLCSGGGGGGTGLAKNAVDTSSADALTGFLYTFTNSGNAETGGVLSLNNGNNTGPALLLKDTSSKALQLQNASGFNALIADTSGTYAHLKVYDGTVTQAYADIYYDDSAGAAIFTASTGKTQVGGGSVPTLITAGSGQALTLTGHASSSWTLDSGDLTLDVTGTTPNMNIGTGATAKTINIGNQTGATAVNIKSGTGNINLNPVGTSSSGVVIKPQSASTLALQVQNSTTSKVVMSVDNSGNQVVIGDGSASGITGKLAFSAAGASGKIILTPAASPGASTFTLQLPAENGTICTTAGSAACLAVYGGGVSGSFLAKDSVDTSSADSGAGALYTFTNSGITGSGGVLKLDNGSNTGSTLDVTTTANPAAGKAVIYAENKNASPSGNLLDLESGSTPASVFSVDATGAVTAAGQLSVIGTTLSGSSLIFGDGSNPSSIQAGASQALNVTANATSLWQVGGTNQNLTIQTSGTGTLAIDTTGAGTVNLGNSNAAAINIGAASGAVTTIGGGDAAHTIHIGDGGVTADQIISIGSASGASATTIAAGSGNLNFNASSALFTEVTGTRTLGIQTRSTNVAGTNFLIQAGAGGSGASAVGGGTLTLSGGNAAGTGNANGGNVNLSGGTGVGTGANGLVVLNTPAFATTTADPNCYTGGAPVSASCTIAQSSVDGSAAILVGFFNSGQTATLPDPTIKTPGRVIYITAASGSMDFTLSVNGGGTGNQIAMRQNTSATMIWSGSVWTAAGASSSTTLQAAYDNTLQSAGGAELVVSHTSATNGLTIRDSITNPVNGTLLSVQAASASTLFSVNDSVAEYSSDGGAEVAGGTSSTFPASTWSAAGAATVSRYTTAGNFINTGQGSVSVQTTTAANDGVSNTLSTALTANVHYNVSFAVRLGSGTFPQMVVYYSVDGSAQSVTCATGLVVPTSVWKKINCAFQAPATGITASNAILIEQTLSGTSRTFYVDNISVTIAADYNYATDGGVDDGTNFAANWSFVDATSGAGSVSRNVLDGHDASDSAAVAITTGAANAGIRNKLAISPLTNTLYRVAVYAKVSSGTFTDFKVRYSPTGSTGSSGTYVDCTDYNTQVITTTDWTQITCYINTDGTVVTSPYIDFVEGSSAVRTFYVDTFSMTLSTNTAPNIQIGGGVNGGPVALLTLDRAASAPIAANNDALLGSMYYDTTLGKLQCYEADGWGACGSSPDNIVTISPEYTNAVMHGTGVGTMTSDICSSTLHINDGYNPGDPTICGTNETFNFYKWTSPQLTAQTYSIYVTYQLPGTFKSFSSGQTSIMGRTDSSNATVAYEIYRDSSTLGLIQCGVTITVSNGSVSSWQPGTATGATDPSTCSFNPGDSIVFKIDVTASQDADAYVGNLNFTFTNK